MKKALATLGILLLLFIGFVLFNTFTFKSKQLSVPSKPYITVSDSSISRLRQAITYRTVSYDDTNKLDSSAFMGFQRFLIRSFPKAFEKMSVEKVNK